MFRRLCSSATAFCMILLSVITLRPTLGFATLDVPQLVAVSIDRSSARLLVTAGPSGTPSGFTVEWMTRADYDAEGGWPTNPSDPRIVTCSFTGSPTLTVMPGVADYTLGSGVSTLVEIGDLHDETGIYTYYDQELGWNSEYVFRVFANGSENDPQSAHSQTVFVTTDPGGDDCIFTQGFWKNHVEMWPTVSLQLGTVVYSATELQDILDTPAAGNGLIFLSHQLIAAKLNVGAGADPTSIQSAIDDADALIGGLIIPPVGSGFIHPSNASDLTEQLDQFNNGKLGVECNLVTVEPSTWSGVKRQYR